MTSEYSAHRLAVSELTVRFGGILAVDAVNVHVDAKEWLGILGPNGAGKTTLLSAISGLVRPSGGEVWLDGARVTGRPSHRLARLGLARTYQHPKIFPELTVSEHLVTARIAARGHREGVDGTRFRRTKLTRARENIEALLRLLGLEDHAERKVEDLPLGLVRVVELGRALAVGPKVLLLDEPSSGVDHVRRIALIDAVKHYSSENGTGVILVEHDVELVRRSCDRVAVLDFGRVITEGPPDEALENEDVRSAYLGIATAEQQP